MLALQTDMSIPKDVNRIRLQVFVGDNLQHDETYAVAPEPGGTKLPATLAIVAGENPNPTVQVRVIGIRMDGDDTFARTFAKVVTTVPKSRIATLRVPIQWLCDGTAEEVGDDDYKSSCENDGDEERACVAGDCKSVLVDSATLPDFAPEEIFGGDPGPNGIAGVCFDTVPCMDPGFQAEPNDECELVLDVPQGRDVNVALEFPAHVGEEEGTGICGEEACYVPLDQDPIYGWSLTSAGSGTGGNDSGDEPGDGGAEAGGSATVKLPVSVCRRLNDGSVDAVRVSYSCQTKTPKYPTCGEWSSVDEGTVPDGGSAGGSGGSGGTGGGDTTGSVIATSTTGVAGMTGQCESLSGDGPVDTGSPGLDAYLESVQQFAPFAEQYRAITEQGCANLLGRGAGVGLDGQALLDLCAEAALEVESILTAQELNVVLTEGHCVVDVDAQNACEESCGASETCAMSSDSEEAERCSEFAGDCETSAPCPDGCYASGGNQTACAGSCFGVCRGTCSGRCTLPDGSISTDGCDGGMCQGTCSGTCEGNCFGGEVCDKTCLGDEPSSICGGSAANLACRIPLSTLGCPDDLCAASCALETITQQTCTLSAVSSYPSTPDGSDGGATEDRLLLELNLGPLADVTLQTQALEITLEQLTTILQAVSQDPELLDQPELVQCLNEGVTLHSEAINSLNFAVASAASVVNSFYFTDVGVFVPGGGGDGGTGGVAPTGGTGGVEGIGGTTSGGTAGEGGSRTTGSAGSGPSTGGTAGIGGSLGTGGSADVGGSAGVGGIGGSAGIGGFGGSAGFGGSGGYPTCDFVDPDSCESCLREICCSSVSACNDDAACGPVESPDSGIQCIVTCQGGYAPLQYYCEELCTGGGAISSATATLLSCGSECSNCQPPIGL